MCDLDKNTILGLKIQFDSRNFQIMKPGPEMTRIQAEKEETKQQTVNSEERLNGIVISKGEDLVENNIVKEEEKG